MIPRIAAEQLISTFAGQAYGRAALLDGGAKQQQGGVYVCHAGQAARLSGGQQGGTQGCRFDHYIMVDGVQGIGHELNILIVTVRLKITFRKILVVILIIH